MRILRLVTKRESNGEVGWRGGGSYFDTLSCGHVVRMKRSAGRPARRRCVECESEIKKKPETYEDCAADCHSLFKPLACKTCLCCRGCAGAYDYTPGGKKTGRPCPECRL